MSSDVNSLYEGRGRVSLLLSDHSVRIQLCGRHRFNDVPVLDYLIVFDSKNIDHSQAELSRNLDEVGMRHHQIAFRDDALNHQLHIRKGSQSTEYERDK